jgi:hypothetical protein
MILHVPVAAQKQLSTFRFQPAFFGLTDDYTKSVYEQFFILKHFGGWSFIEAYNLPIGLRQWFVERVIKQYEDEKAEIEKHKRKS